MDFRVGVYGRGFEFDGVGGMDEETWVEEIGFVVGSLLILKMRVFMLQLRAIREGGGGVNDKSGPKLRTENSV